MVFPFASLFILKCFSLLHRGPQLRFPNLGTSRTLAQNEPFLFETWLSQVFSYSEGKRLTSGWGVPEGLTQFFLVSLSHLYNGGDTSNVYSILYGANGIWRIERAIELRIIMGSMSLNDGQKFSHCL